MTETFLNWRELGMSILQGLVITAGVLFMYQFTVRNGGNGRTDPDDGFYDPYHGKHFSYTCQPVILLFVCHFLAL